MSKAKLPPIIYASALLRKVDAIIHLVDNARSTSFEGNLLTVDGKSLRDPLVELRKMMLSHRRQNRTR